MCAALPQIFAAPPPSDHLSLCPHAPLPTAKFSEFSIQPFCMGCNSSCVKLSFAPGMVKIPNILSEQPARSLPVNSVFH